MLLAELTAAAAPGSFVAARFRVEPVTLDEVMAINAVYQNLERAEVEAAAAGGTPFRLIRVQPFEE